MKGHGSDPEREKVEGQNLNLLLMRTHAMNSPMPPPIKNGIILSSNNYLEPTIVDCIGLTSQLQIL